MKSVMKMCKFLLAISLFNVINSTLSSDPFHLLGIPNLNPSQIFQEDDVSFKNGFSELNDNSIKKGAKFSNSVNPSIKSIEDLPTFLQNSNISQEEGLRIISKFLMADDYLLKKFGAVFDQTGFDGLMNMEPIHPVGSKERSAQRAKSAAKLFFNGNFGVGFEAYGAELISSQVVSGWDVYKVLLVGKNANKHSFLKVCLPVDENCVPIVSQINLECIDKVIKNLI